MVKTLFRRLGLVAVLALGAGAPVAAAAAVPASASVAAPAASQVRVTHGVAVFHTQSKRAGSCSIYVDWTARYGSQNTGVKSEVWVKPYIDECSGGGTLKFRAEMICTTDGGGLQYYYGVWNNGAGNTSYVDQGNNCWEAVGTANGAPTVAAFQENMNNPTRITCDGNLFFNANRKASGSNCGTTT